MTTNTDRKLPDDRRMQELIFEELADGDEELRMLCNRGVTFFEPNMAFAKWIGDYAKDRVVVEIGSGCGHVLHLLRHAGHSKVVGIEPAWDVVAGAQGSIGSQYGMLQVIPWTVEKASKMLFDLTKSGKALILICRPCHGNYVEDAIDAVSSGTEIMYITKKDNLTEYTDCGRYQHLLQEIPHEGSSTDDEVVCVLTKP